MASGMYDLDDSKQKIQILRQLLQLQIEIDTLKDLLDKHGIISSLEFESARNYIAMSPKYKDTIEQLAHAESTIQHYKDDPQAYLRDLMKAKMQGR